MDHAPLRPVPTRPSGPVPDAVAVRQVAATVPAAGERDALALALVALVGHGRSEVARRLGLDEAELAAALTRARKELRRTVLALPGSGWCERAELSISDRLDDPLPDRDEHRLATHLRNCPRCVEHERRLVQATDALVAALPEAAPARPLAAVPARAELEVAADAADVAPLSEAAPPAEAPDSVAGWYALIGVCLLLAIVAIAAVIAGAVA